MKAIKESMKKSLLLFFISITIISTVYSAIEVKPAIAVARGLPCQSTPSGSTCDPGLVCAGTTPGVPGNGVCIDRTATAKTAAQLYLSNPNAPSNQSIVPIIALHGGTNMIESEEWGGGPVLARTMVALYLNKPASTAVALRDFSENMGLTKTAYAQGYGFEALNPILPLWKVMRNLALGGFVIIFVVVGIMIMLRKNIDPRTVITIQQALPKIIVSLILVLFSYAIFGLLVDAVTVATRAGLFAFQQAGLVAKGNQNKIFPKALAGKDNEGNDESCGTNDCALSAAENIDVLSQLNIFGLFENLYNIDNLVGALESQTSLNSATGQFDIVKGFFGSVPGTTSLLRLVILIAMFVAMLRTFFMLLTSYLMVVISIILSPLKILMMAIPGSQGSVESWLRGILSHLLVFPVVFFMLVFAAIFSARAGGNLWWESPGEPGKPNYWNVSKATDGNPQGVFPLGSNFWAPPALGDWGSVVGPLLSLGILLTIPKTSAIVKEAIDPKSRNPAEGAAADEMKQAARKIPILKGYV